jgi:hypothetical protein
MWTQGLDQAPAVPRACVETWMRHNPDWDLTVLDAETLCDWADPALCGPRAQSLHPYRLSELARLSLLLRHGGVWADATCFCMRPLDEWLPGCLESGFFAFASPGPDRILASWFLASAPGDYVVRRMWEELGSYYLGHELPFGADLLPPGWRNPAARVLGRVLNGNRRSAQLWFAPPLPQLGISPYMAFHYQFARLLRIDGSFREIWERTVKVTADGPHGLQKHGLEEPPSPAVLAELEERRVPVYKLRWRIDPTTLPQPSTIKVLLDRY